MGPRLQRFAGRLQFVRMPAIEAPGARQQGLELRPRASPAEDLVRLGLQRGRDLPDDAARKIAAGVEPVLVRQADVLGVIFDVSAVTIGEIQAGIEITRAQDEAKAREIEAWLEMVAASYNVLPMDAGTFRAWARWMHRRSDTVYEDAMIAATAMVHGLTVVTRHVADFKPFGVALLDPFKK